MRMLMRGSVALAAGLVLAAAGAGPAPAAEKASLRLDWRLVGYHLPFYWAHAKGYYAQEGLDLTIGEGTGSGATVQILGGNKDTFGHADATVMANAVGKGMPIKAVAAPLQQMAWAYIAYEATRIVAPKDLIGKSIAVVANHKPLHDLFLERHNIPADKVTLRLATAQTRNILLAEKKVDAFLSIIIGSPLDFVVKEKQGGEKVSFLRFSEWGIDTLGYVIMVHNQTLAERPAAIRAFLRATKRGGQKGPANLEEALRIAVKYSPRGEGEEDAVRLGFQESMKMVQSPNAKGRPWGWMAQADWEHTQAVLLSTKAIEKAIPLDQYYTNAFLPD